MFQLPQEKDQEQPPRNPCARCTKKNLPCEYVTAAEPEYYSSSRPQTPDTDPGHSRTHSSSASRPTTPMMASAFSGGRGAAPPLPYTGPPAMVMTPTGWGYVAPSRRGPNFAAVNPGPGPNAHPQYYPPGGAAPQYAPGYGSLQYDSQLQYPADPGSQPTFTQPQAGGFDYSEFNDYDGSQAQSSRYPSNNPRYQ
ncbi:hypothetical protein B0H17DRAFT_1328612 [Mycena rosella]|uniref:Zn(2)-C6 fungal-type domain-containing protein n=1 Tax=Mycena rosella TaxID=1033263 RepID=A0AAD7DSV2_MYCRO|nr:hypothetical protein B0H17DRAFT_1328612 [Mycena rosella]